MGEEDWMTLQSLAAYWMTLQSLAALRKRLYAITLGGPYVSFTEASQPIEVNMYGGGGKLIPISSVKRQVYKQFQANISWYFFCDTAGVQLTTQSLQLPRKGVLSGSWSIYWDTSSWLF